MIHLRYTTYFKKFSKWNNLNLFENIYKIIIKLLNNKDLLFINNIKDLYIDSTDKISIKIIGSRIGM